MSGASDNAPGFVGNIPLNYDRHLGPLVFADYAADIARRAAAANPARVLETAAGTGIVTRALRDRLPAGARLVATDFSPPMIEIARGKFRAGERVEFQPADATALPFPDRSFDAVVCQFGVMFYPDKDKSYREVHRVLAPGGRYLFSIWDSHRHNAFGRIAHEVVGRFFPADPPQFFAVPFAYGFEPIRDSLIEAGFAGIEATVLRFVKEVPDMTDLARGLVYGSPVIDQIAVRGGIDAEQVFDALLAEFRRAFGSNPAPLPLQAIVFSATKPA